MGQTYFENGRLCTNNWHLEFVQSLLWYVGLVTPATYLRTELLESAYKHYSFQAVSAAKIILTRHSSWRSARYNSDELFFRQKSMPL